MVKQVISLFLYQLKNRTYQEIEMNYLFKYALALTITVGLASCGEIKKEDAVAEKRIVSEDGTLHVSAFDLPPSGYISKEAREILTPYRMVPLFWAIEDVCPLDYTDLKSVYPWRKCVNETWWTPLLARAKEKYDVTIQSITIKGSSSYNIFDVRPAAGIALKNQERVLIHIPGSALLSDTDRIAQLNAIPIAALGHIRVVGIDYRKGPEFQHPAVLEDVTAVYKALLKDYKPENIGVYGCSAGGYHSGLLVSWLLQKGLPLPGALSIGGEAPVKGAKSDSDLITLAMSGMPLPPPKPESSLRSSVDHPYYSNLAVADMQQPFFSPASSPELAKSFPPTLLVNSSRDYSVGRAFYAHSQLIKYGVEADLHVWEGLPHCFWADPDIPESSEVYSVIVNFFDKHLGE